MYVCERNTKDRTNGEWNYVKKDYVWIDANKVDYNKR